MQDRVSQCRRSCGQANGRVGKCMVMWAVQGRMGSAEGRVSMCRIM